MFGNDSIWNVGLTIYIYVGNILSYKAYIVLTLVKADTISFTRLRGVGLNE